MINLNTSTMHKVFKSRRNMMGIIHMESLKTMCPPGYVGSKSTQDIGIYKLDLHLHIRYTSTPHKTPKSCRSKMNIRHICNHCLVITKMALWQLKHLGTCCVWCTVRFFIVYKNLLAKFCYMSICRVCLRNWRQNVAIIQCY